MFKKERLNMGVKLNKEKYIKNKIKNTFGQFEVYNPQHELKILEELTKMIQNNSQQIPIENGNADIEVTNVTQIMRYMLLNLTNIDSDWNEIDDIELERILNLADGDFKKVVNSLLDIMIEIGEDISLNNMRKLKILNNKLNEMAKSIETNIEIDETLSSFGLDREKLIKLQNGDEEIIKEFQENIVKQASKPKSKRGRPKKSNK
jgi:hypothetical protein